MGLKSLKHLLFVHFSEFKEQEGNQVDHKVHRKQIFATFEPMRDGSNLARPFSMNSMAVTESLFVFDGPVQELLCTGVFTHDLAFE